MVTMDADGLIAALQKAVDLHQAGRLDDAIRQYDMVLDADPENVEALNFSALAHFARGEAETAAERLARAVGTRPDYGEAQANHGLVLRALGRMDDAVAALAQATALLPNDVEAPFNLGNIHLAAGRPAEAATALRTAVGRAPGHAPAHAPAQANLARALLELGDWPDALAACEQCLASTPGHTGALAMAGVALAELGESRRLATLLDFDGLVGAHRPPPPFGMADIGAFNRALADHVQRDASLAYEPDDVTTRKGYQSADLMADPKGPLGAFKAIIESAVAVYREHHPIEAGHPYLGQRPARWTLNAWATILEREGHQAPHIHRSAWLSGVYYVQLPDNVRDAVTGNAGWIEFGRPPPYPAARAEAPMQFYRPEEGLMLLFPSYMYHRTIPFDAGQRRISIAFDVLPSLD